MRPPAPAGISPRTPAKIPNFRCKHILSVMNSVPLGEIENGCFLEKKRPKLDERWIIEIEGSINS